MVAGPVHFVYLGGPFVWQHWRAIETARVHGAPIILWCASEPTAAGWEIEWCGGGFPGLEIRELAVADWLRDHPIKLANVKDRFAWRILHDHGGLYLDLDTISLRPVWDLLTRDVLVSCEHEPGFDAGHPYNSAVVAARKGAPILGLMAEQAEAILSVYETQWGACGPRLLTANVAAFPESFDVAPMPLLNGWRDDTIYRYYDGEKPPPGTRVVHLFSSSRPERFLADRWMP